VSRALSHFACGALAAIWNDEPRSFEGRDVCLVNDVPRPIVAVRGQIDRLELAAAYEADNLRWRAAPATS